jgi:hypothetical protein
VGSLSGRRDESAQCIVSVENRKYRREAGVDPVASSSPADFWKFGNTLAGRGESRVVVFDNVVSTSHSAAGKLLCAAGLTRTSWQRQQFVAVSGREEVVRGP